MPPSRPGRLPPGATPRGSQRMPGHCGADTDCGADMLTLAHYGDDTDPLWCWQRPTAACGCAAQVWPCSEAQVWPCSEAQVWPCSKAQVWPCSEAQVWPYSEAQVWRAVRRRCGCAARRKCGRAVRRRCGRAAMRKCGPAVRRRCGHAASRRLQVARVVACSPQHSAGAFF
eukprot:363590-Chlamydomonas_euryale.AAC.7